jgi:acylphosphatase
VILLKLARAHVLITGFVQGVSFRSSTIRKAVSLGLKGWVRNLENDKVEAVFEGQEDRVKEMLEWCKKGPPFSRVDDIKIDFGEYRGEFENFGRR